MKFLEKIKKNDQRGFTLVEVIVVLIIIAIMAAMMVPKLTGWIEESKKKAALADAHIILSALQATVTEYHAYNNGAINGNIKDRIWISVGGKITPDMNANENKVSWQAGRKFGTYLSGDVDLTAVTNFRGLAVGGAKIENPLGAVKESGTAFGLYSGYVDNGVVKSTGLAPSFAYLKNGYVVIYNNQMDAEGKGKFFVGKRSTTAGTDFYWE